MKFSFIPKAEFDRVWSSSLPKSERLSLIADMSRLNTLTSVKKAGSGHLGSSFSSMDVMAFLFYGELNTFDLGFQHPDRDVFFSSKGHDAPAHYALLHAKGLLSEEQLFQLRRISGLPGHPEIGMPGIETATGSLGMGISKAAGFLMSKRIRKNSGRALVLTGDGEWQEGQNFEALQAVVHHKLNELTVLVDHNKVQSDKLLSDTLDLGAFETKLTAFGWHVERCDGHNFQALLQCFKSLKQMGDKPKILILDTVKGQGVSFMGHTSKESWKDGLYRFHSGAPDDETYSRAVEELQHKIQKQAGALSPIQIQERNEEPIRKVSTSDNVSKAFGETLVSLAETHPELAVLDGDLILDCSLIEFQKRFPERFIECGIAEQHMVSQAGALAIEGFLPVVNSFGCFLSARACEQIYNNACEKTKIIYVNHYSGLVPAAPGASHQSLRDMALWKSLPGEVTVLCPCNAKETGEALRYFIQHGKGVCVLRLFLGASPNPLELPERYRLEKGRGVALKSGKDGILFSYGPLMLAEALKAAELLKQKKYELQVVNLPWMNRLDAKWLGQTVTPFKNIFVLEDHGKRGGLSEDLLSTLQEHQLLSGKSFQVFAVEGHPACGTKDEVLKAHGLDAKTLASKVSSF